MREELIAQKNKVFLITDRSAREYFTGIDNAEGKQKIVKDIK